MADLPILVIAGDYRQYVFWCREHEINPNDMKRVRYVRDWNSICGRRGNPYVTYGTYYQRRDMVEIRQALKVIEAVPLEEYDG